MVGSLDEAQGRFSKLVVPANRYESGFREWGRQDQHGSDLLSHGGFSKTTVCERTAVRWEPPRPYRAEISVP
jgi:hypothetical protein